MNEYPPLVIGTMRLGKWGMNFAKKDFQQFVEGCLAMGLNAFDHADIYGNYTTQEDFGNLLKESSSFRGEIKLITKCGIRLIAEERPENIVKSYDTRQEYIIHSVETSLKQLGTDYLDLLLIHRQDYLMDPHEVAESFQALQQSGKVLKFGVSNFAPAYYETLNAFFPLMTNQVEISLLKRDAFTDGTLDQCLRHKVRPMAWSPLGGGILFAESNEPEIQRIRQVGEDLCDQYNCELDQLLYAWLLLHPAGIMPVLGTSNLKRVKAAFEALPIRLDRQDWYRLWQAATGKEID